MEEITPEQKAYLATFAGRRDAALLEISNLQIAKEKLEREVKEIADSYSDTEARMNKVLGRIEELTKKEAELPLLIARDIVSLESRKTCLATEVTSLTKMIDVLTVQKASLEKDVSSALATFTAIKDEAISLDAVVDHVVRVSKNNVTLVEDLVYDLENHCPLEVFDRLAADRQGFIVFLVDDVADLVFAVGVVLEDVGDPLAGGLVEGQFFADLLERKRPGGLFEFPLDEGDVVRADQGEVVLFIHFFRFFPLIIP